MYKRQVEGRDKKIGRIIEVYEDKAIIQVFEGTEGPVSYTHQMCIRDRPETVFGKPEQAALKEKRI